MRGAALLVAVLVLWLVINMDNPANKYYCVTVSDAERYFIRGDRLCDTKSAVELVLPDRRLIIYRDKHPTLKVERIYDAQPAGASDQSH